MDFYTYICITISEYMTHIKEFRTQAFKDKVKHIASSKGWTNEKVTYMIKMDGEVKVCRICGVEGEYVAYFKKLTTNGNMETITPIGISVGDIIEFDRDNKLSTLLSGKVIEIKSTKKTIKEPEFIPSVGDILTYFGNYRLRVQVIKVTPRTFTYKNLFSDNIFVARCDKNGRWSGDSYSHFTKEKLSFEEMDKFNREVDMDSMYR